MKTANHAAAWAVLIERKADRRENRCAFIAALIIDRCRAADGSNALTPFQAEQYAVELTRLAHRIKAEAEAACNYERTEAQERADQKNRDRFAAIAEALGFEARTSGDPRGACAYLIDPDDRKGDGWGEGWAVY